MPNRHQRTHRNSHSRDEDVHNNNNHGGSSHSGPAVTAAHNNNRHEAAASGGEGGGGGGHGHGHRGVNNAGGHHIAGGGQARNDNNRGQGGRGGPAPPGARYQKCCTPTSCRTPDDAIDPQDPFDAVKVVCNNEACTEGTWMHKDCFEDFQDSVLSYLRSCGRARSWSEKQRLQNLWTKKGYDLAFKACDCKCSRGHLRKDLDYIPPPINDNAKKQRKHKKKNDKPMPVVSTTHKSNSHSNQTTNGHANGNHNPSTQISNTNGGVYNPHQGNGGYQRERTISGSSNGGGGKKRAGGQKSSSTTDQHKATISMDNSSAQIRHHSLDNQTNGFSSETSSMTPHILTPPSPSTANPLLTSMSPNGNSFFPMPPGLICNPQLRLRTNSVGSVGSVGSRSSVSSVPSSAGSISPVSSSPVSGDMFFKGQGRKWSGDSGDCGATGFRQRLDLSAFACLPRVRQNAYHIRVEEPPKHNSLAHAFSSLSCSPASSKGFPLAWDSVAEEDNGCDAETRNFVLTNLLSKRQTSVRCVLCKTTLPVFDRFPLLDGTFFLSPQPYDEATIQVIWEGRLQYLNAACLGCLEGRTGVRCVSCKAPWDGRALVMGSMYTYDIFAAQPCCQKRLTCKCCRRAVVDIARGLDFFSQYSHMTTCPYCKANDYHFIRPLQDTFIVGSTPAPAPIRH